jgi:hypothetical protein
MQEKGTVERKIIKTGEDNSASSVEQNSEADRKKLENKISEARLEQQKISRLINWFFVGLFLVYLLYLY